MTNDTVARLMVLADEETCTIIDGSFAVDFDSQEDAEQFAESGMNLFHLSTTGETVSVPLYKAVRK